jgi:hypothetical protein
MLAVNAMSLTIIYIKGASQGLSVSISCIWTEKYDLTILIFVRNIHVSNSGSL